MRNFICIKKIDIGFKPARLIYHEAHESSQDGQKSERDPIGDKINLLRPDEIDEFVTLLHRKMSTVTSQASAKLDAVKDLAGREKKPDRISELKSDIKEARKSVKESKMLTEIYYKALGRLATALQKELSGAEQQQILRTTEKISEYISQESVKIRTNEELIKHWEDEARRLSGDLD